MLAVYVLVGKASYDVFLLEILELFAQTGIPEFDILHVVRFQSGQELRS